MGRPWAPLGWLWAALGPLGDPMSSLGGPFGVPRGSLAGPLGVPWGALGCSRRFSQICRKLDAQFRANVSICTRLRIESSLPELARCARSARGADGARGNGSQSAAQTPLVTRAGARLDRCVTGNGSQSAAQSPEDVPPETGLRALLRIPLVTGAGVPEDTLGCLGVSILQFS